MIGLLQDYPVLMARALALANVVRGSAPAGARRAFFTRVALYVLGAVLIAGFSLADRAAFFAEAALSHGEIVAVAAGLLALSLVSRVRDRVRTALTHSWLISTPALSRRRTATAALLFSAAFFGRWLFLLIAIFALSLDASVSLRQCVSLAVLATSGAAAGVLVAWAVSRRQKRSRREDSRYTRRPAAVAELTPSSEALSRWPIAQAFAWSRPENARVLLAAMILSVPGGTGIIGSLAILAAWGLGSYLVAVSIAVPYVARRASQWLRSSPMRFRRFAWSLSWRALLHQLCGTAIAAVGFVSAGVTAVTVAYWILLWLMMCVTMAAIGLADYFRRPYAHRVEA